MFTRPRGTRDYLPEDNVKRRRVIEAFRKVFELYGYGEVLTPAFEHLELLEAKAGPEVKEQIYWFKDKGGRLLGLRFEMTTPIARIVASNPNIPKPIRWYYIAPVWRYEEPQKGRLREFWQAGIELFGSREPEADAEVICVAHDALVEAGLKGEDLIVRVNSRVLSDAIAKWAGAKNLEEFNRVVDKLRKVGKEEVLKQLVSMGCDAEKVRAFLDMADGATLDDVLKLVGDEVKEEAERLKKVIEYCIDSGVKNIVYDPTIVRGLAYYTGTVFEVYHRKHEDIGSLAGGGRYDNLVEVVGGTKLPATGMAIGVERVIEVLEAEGAFKNLRYTPAKVLVTPVKPKDNLIKAALKIARVLRSHNIPTIVNVMKRSLRASLDYADRVGIEYVVIVGEKELAQNKVVVKSMKEYRQEEVALTELPKVLGAQHIMS